MSDYIVLTLNDEFLITGGDQGHPFLFSNDIIYLDSDGDGNIRVNDIIKMNMHNQDNVMNLLYNIQEYMNNYIRKIGLLEEENEYEIL